MQNVFELFLETLFRFFAVGYLDFPARTFQHVGDVIVAGFSRLAMIRQQLAPQLVDFPPRSTSLRPGRAPRPGSCPFYV